MPRPGPPLSHVLVLPAGVLLGHAVGYGVGHHHGAPTASHAHLSTVAVVATLLAATGLAVAVARRQSEAAHPALPVWRVAALQTTAFLALESAEQIAVGRSPVELAGSPAIWIGMLAQVAVAGLTRGALRLVATVPVAAWIVPSGTIQVRPGGFWTPLAAWAPSSAAACRPAGPRGPPGR